MLSEEKRKQFKEILTQNLFELLNKSERSILGLDQNEDRHTDFVDLAAFESNAGLLLHFSERKSKLISKIKVALEKIDSGEFGICEECEEEISEARLMARPIAALCIDCKREQERVEKLREG